MEIYEHEIENWMFDNPDRVPFIDGWIDRQLILDNKSRLDLLGYGDFRGHKGLFLFELKARRLKVKDVIQAKRYEYHLIRTIERMGFVSLRIFTFLFGFNTRSIDSMLLDVAEVTNVGIYSMEITGRIDNIKFTTWDWPNLEEGFDTKVMRLMNSGHYDNLSSYLIPLMPDFIQNKYKVGVDK